MNFCKTKSRLIGQNVIHFLPISCNYPAICFTNRYTDKRAIKKLWNTSDSFEPICFTVFACFDYFVLWFVLLKIPSPFRAFPLQVTKLKEMPSLLAPMQPRIGRVKKYTIPNFTSYRSLSLRRCSPYPLLVSYSVFWCLSSPILP